MKIKNPNNTNISIITRLRGADLKAKEEKYNYKYTTFSNNNNYLYYSEDGLDLSEINNIFMKEEILNLKYFNFNKVYSPLYSIDLIYQEILKNPINDLFYNKNSCLFFFGPSFGGKSYLLRGSTIKNENETGLLTKSIDDLLLKIGLNNNDFSIKISVYQIYMDQINDLLYENENFKNIIDISRVEIKNRKEFDLTLREAINNRNNLYKNKLINDNKGKSHLIISIYLENKNEIKILPFTQIDFVELASCDYGLLNENEISKNINNQIFKNINKTFNLIAENIINISKKDAINDDNDKLISSLKNTMKPDSNIIFINCIIPWEYPLKHSYNSSKFSNMIYNQLYKYDIKKINNYTYSLDYNINNNTINNDMHNNIKYSTNNMNINTDNNISSEKMNEYLNNLTINRIERIFQKKEIYKTKTHKIEPKRKIMMKMPINNKKKIVNNKNKIKSQNIYNKINLTFDIKNPSPKEQKLREINKALKEIEKKSKELNKLSKEKDSEENDIYNNSEINRLNRTINSVENNAEYAELKSDNIILREDLERLNNINKNLEYSLMEERNRNLKIINENEELGNRIIKLEKILEEMNEREKKNKMKEMDIEKLLNEKIIMTTRIDEEEKELNKLKEERENYKVEYKILLTQYNDLKYNYDIILNEFDKVKIMHDEQLNGIENKVDNLMDEINKLRNENNILRKENEKQRNDINEMNIENEEYKERFIEIKKDNDILNEKYKEMEKEYNEYKREKMNEYIIKAKYEDNKRIKNENKMKIVNELHSKIQNYRRQRLNQDTSN